MPSLRRAAVMVSTAVALTPLPADAAPFNIPRCEAVTSRGGGWYNVAGPSPIAVVETPGGIRRDVEKPNPIHVVFAAKSPKRLYLATRHQVFRSDDSGCTWTEIFDTRNPTYDPAVTALGAAGTAPLNTVVFAHSAILDVVPSPVDPATVYVVFAVGSVGTNGTRYTNGLYVVRSTDAGARWSPLNGNRNVVDLSHITDELSHFSGGTEIDTPVRHRTLFIAPSDPNRLYLKFARTIYRTDDGGLTWSAAGTLGSTGCSGTELAVSPVNADEVWTHGVWGALLRSRDGGRSFEEVKSFNGHGGRAPAACGHHEGNFIVLFARPGRPIEIWAVQKDVKTILRSVNGGVAWSAMPGHAGNVWGLASDARDRVAMITSASNTLYVFNPRGNNTLTRWRMRGLVHPTDANCETRSFAWRPNSDSLSVISHSADRGTAFQFVESR